MESEGLVQALIESDCLIHDVVDGVVVERPAPVVVDVEQSVAEAVEDEPKLEPEPRVGFWQWVLRGLKHALWMVLPERGPQTVETVVEVETVSAKLAGRTITFEEEVEHVEEVVPALQQFLRDAAQALQESKLTGADPDAMRPESLDDDLGSLAVHVHALRGAVHALDEAIHDASMDDFSDVRFAWTELLDTLEAFQREPRHLDTGLVAGSLKRVARRAAREGLEQLQAIDEGRHPVHLVFDVEPVMREYVELAKKHQLPT